METRTDLKSVVCRFDADLGYQITYESYHMNKVLLAVLCALSFSAHAQITYGLGGTAEYDSATKNDRPGLESVSKVGIVGGIRGKYGQLDGGLYEVYVNGKRFHDTQQGVEVGYGLGKPIGPFVITGRVAAGKLFNRGLGLPGASDIGYYRTYTAGIGYPINDRLTLSATYRFRPKGDLEQQELYTLGGSYFLNKTTSLQLGVRQTRSTNGPILNGVSSMILFYF